MCIIGNQKTQEAKNKVIHHHKQFAIWCVLLGLVCVFIQLSIHFYVIKIIQLCIMLFHTSWIFTISKSQSYEYLDNQEYTTLTQYGRKKCNPVFLGEKNFTEDKNGNRLLDKIIVRVMIKILHSLNIPLKMRHEATEYTKYNASKRIHYPI